MCLELDMLVLMAGNPSRIEEGHVGSLIIFLPKRLCRILVLEVGDVIGDERAERSRDTRRGGKCRALQLSSRHVTGFQ